MRAFLIIVLVIILLVSGCEKPVNLGCENDNDCGVGGCSGQICDSKARLEGLFTTCEYMPEYGCYKLSECKCIENKCAWQENEKFKECLKGGA